ncbi:MAG: HNH endonuclease signature motif containing protein [Mycobacterium sp.]
MRSIDREDVVEVFEALEADLDRALELSFDALSTPERLALLGRCERLRRRLPAIEHPLINTVAEQADATELGGKLHWALADRLHITRGEAKRRVDEAAELGPRCTLTGQLLEPVLAATAAVQRAGHLGPAHVQVIRDFFHQLPVDIDGETRANAEAHLAGLAAAHRPDELTKLASLLMDCLNPNGNFSDSDRARRRSLILGRQTPDGMSPINGYLDPQARATLDAVLARWAAPGMCNPADEIPCLHGSPGQAAIDNDTRSAGQRNHDALFAMGRNLLASGQLGQHNGLPATVVVSVSLQDLEAAAGKAITGGGTWLPVRDLIRLASDAHHYLRVYDGAKEVALHHAKRIATAGQRLALYARDRGCTHPGCDVPGYLTEVHHVTDYAQTHRTTIDELTLRCGPHHKIITSGAWKTRKRSDGTIQTVPPAHLDHGQSRVNTCHHPDKLLAEIDHAATDDP